MVKDTLIIFKINFLKSILAINEKKRKTTRVASLTRAWRRSQTYVLALMYPYGIKLKVLSLGHISRCFSISHSKLTLKMVMLIKHYIWSLQGMVFDNKKAKQNILIIQLGFFSFIESITNFLLLYLLLAHFLNYLIQVPTRSINFKDAGGKIAALFSLRVGSRCLIS